MLTMDGKFLGAGSKSGSGEMVLAFSQRLRASDGSETRVLSALRSRKADVWGPVEIVAAYSGDARIASANVIKDGRAMIIWEHAEPGAVHHLKSSLSP